MVEINKNIQGKFKFLNSYNMKGKKTNKVLKSLIPSMNKEEQSPYVLLKITHTHTQTHTHIYIYISFRRAFKRQRLHTLKKHMIESREQHCIFL